MMETTSTVMDAVQLARLRQDIFAWFLTLKVFAVMSTAVLSQIA
jgi:hypothetical protein